MSDNGEHLDSERADTGSKWVWGSTEESVERGAISVLACVEVAAGIWLYWWLIPWWFETNLHLLISVLVAPLLLLRSPASVDAALPAFERLIIGEDFSLRSKRGVGALLLAVGLSAAVSWGLAETWLGGHDGWSLFWRAGIIGWISVPIGIVGAETLAAAVAGRGIGGQGVVVAGALAGAVAGALAGTVAGAGALAGAVAGAVAFAGALAVAVVLDVGVLLIAPGWLLGIWLRSVTVRIDSTLRHWKAGWRRLSVNWRSLVWAHDLRRPPELLPGIDQVPELSDFGIGHVLDLYKCESGAKRALGIVIASIALPIFFLPAWFYRFSLKSTCWFWWPLVFSQTSGRTAAQEVAKRGTPGAGVVFEEQTNRLRLGLSLTLLVTAIVVPDRSLTSLMAAIGVPDSLLALLPVSGGGIGLLGALGDMIYLMLPCAGVQLVLFVLSDQFLVRAKAGDLAAWPRTAFLWLFKLRQLLLGSALVVALVLLLENWVPVLTPFAEWVETHYFSWFPLLARP